MLPRPIPTATDQVIGAQDVMLLQYVHSDESAWHGFEWSTLLADLLRKFRVVFGPSITSLSLRHAMLSFGATLSPFPELCDNRREDHAASSCKALMMKTPTTVDESDLFAVFVLALVSCVRGDFSTFLTHLQGVVALLNELTKKTSNGGYLKQLLIFRPLIRDLLLESGRTFLRANSWVIWFFYHLPWIDRTSLICRIRYLDELNIVEPRGQYAFLQAVWQYSVILRNCFRETLSRQLQGFENMEGDIESVVSELRCDLRSKEMTEAPRISDFLQRKSSFRLQSRFVHVCTSYHTFCHLLIMLLEAKTFIQGTKSIKAEFYALFILRLTNTEWLNSDTSLESIFPRPLSRVFVLRILSIAGLVLTRQRFPNGTCAKKFLSLTGRSRQNLPSTYSSWSGSYGKWVSGVLELWSS